MSRLFDAFSDVCIYVWDRLKDSKRFRIPQNEVTLTENILLKIVRNPRTFPSICLLHTPRDVESKIGSDWEWWIGKGQHRLHFAVQAKKLPLKKLDWDAPPLACTEFAPDKKYKIGSKSGGRHQRDRLKDYAAIHPEVIPLYAFYNCMDDKYLAGGELDNKPPSGYWSCCQQPPDRRMLGFTVTPLASIERAASKPRDMSFDKIHKIPETIPVRCLFCRKKNGLAALFGKEWDDGNILKEYERPLPKELQTAMQKDGNFSLEGELKYFSNRMLIMEDESTD